MTFDFGLEILTNSEEKNVFIVLTHPAHKRPCPSRKEESLALQNESWMTTLVNQEPGKKCLKQLFSTIFNNFLRGAEVDTHLGYVASRDRVQRGTCLR